MSRRADEIIKVLRQTSLRQMDTYAIQDADGSTLEENFPSSRDPVTSKRLCENTNLKAETDENTKKFKRFRQTVQFVSQSLSWAIRNTRKIQIIWLNFDIPTNKYQQMHADQGGGIRKIVISKSASLVEITNLAKQTFFPGGNSPCGKVADFCFVLFYTCSSKVVYTSRVTVGEMYKQTGLTTIKFYLVSKYVLLADEANSDLLNDDSVRDKSLENEMLIKLKDQILSAAADTSSGICSTTPNAYSSGGKSNTNMAKTFERNHTSHQPTTKPLITNSTHEETRQDDTKFLLSSTKIIQRGPLLFQEFISHFKDASISHKKIRVEPIETEQGEGVTRDLLTEFWACFYSQCTNGLTTKVPCLHHDFGLEEWKSIARVLCYGWGSTGYWPIQLSYEFMNHCLYGEMPAPHNLLEDYFEFMPIQDKHVFQSALDNYERVDKEDLLKALESHNCRTAVQANNLKAVLKEMAHKEIQQNPRFVSDCWREVFSDFKVTPKLEEIYSSLRVTNKKVVNMFKFSFTQTVPESKVTESLQKYVLELDHIKLVRFLRFCTGSDLITVQQIKVEYRLMNGASHRPIADRSKCVLRLHIKYVNFKEFCSDFDRILESNV